MSRSRSTLAANSNIGHTKGFEKVPPRVQEWLRTLRPISHNGVRAWVAPTEYPFAEYDDVLAWTPDQIKFATELFRPHPADLADFVSDQGLEEFDEEGSAAEAVWRAFYEGESAIRWTPADSLFGLSFAVDQSFNSSSWHWSVETLSEGLGLFSTNGDHRDNYLFPCVFGVVDRADPIKSAALLLHESGYHDSSFLGAQSYDELHAHGLLDEDVYRLLLAHTGRVRMDALAADRRALRAYKPSWARRGFTRMMDVLRNFEPKGSEVLNGPAPYFETLEGQQQFPLFDGYPYVMTRLAPALYNLIVLPADADDWLIDTAQTQVWANRLPTCLVLSETRAIYFHSDGSPSVSTAPPRGGNIISGHLAPVRRFAPSTALRARQRRASRFIEKHRSDGYVLGDITKGGRPSTDTDRHNYGVLASLRSEADVEPTGIKRCEGCGDWRGQCFDPNPALEGWVVPVSCFCDNDNRCASCGELLHERKLAANYYNPTDGQIWHVPGFMAKCRCTHGTKTGTVSVIGDEVRPASGRILGAVSTT